MNTFMQIFHKNAIKFNRSKNYISLSKNPQISRSISQT